MSYFDGIQVGDRVWTFRIGWGTVYNLDNTETPICVNLDDRVSSQHFTMNGKLHKEDICQSLFWDEIKITPPPRPKKKEKKMAECWANVYQECKETAMCEPDLELDGKEFCFHKSADQAKRMSDLTVLAIAKVTIEWEE